MRKIISVVSGAALAFAMAASTASAQAIATADGEKPGLRIDVTELKRTSGDTLTLKFTLINDSSEQVWLPDLFETSQAVSEVHLIDAAGKKKYLTIKDSSGKCVCSAGIDQRLQPGEAVNLWARFPAPPAEVAEISVIFPHFIPTDAPISE